MKKKTTGKTISFHSQWQSKPEFGEMIYLFILKNEAGLFNTNRECVIPSTLIGRRIIVSPIHVDIISNRAMSALGFFFLGGSIVL